DPDDHRVHAGERASSTVAGHGERRHQGRCERAGAGRRVGRALRQVGHSARRLHARERPSACTAPGSPASQAGERRGHLLRDGGCGYVRVPRVAEAPRRGAQGERRPARLRDVGVLKRTHVEPFLRVRGNRIELEYLADESGRVVPFLDRLCRLTRKLEGWPRVAVAEALRRQERHVRDAARLSGISRALLDACVFKAPEGAERAEEVRAALFRVRGKRWPPVPGDRSWLLRETADSLGVAVEDVDRLLYADAPGARLLVRAPAWDGRELLAHYNLELARAVLLDA